MNICKTVTFDAAHRLDKLPPDHKCHRLYGHTYRVDIVVDGPADDLGMICDYAEIDTAWAPLHDGARLDGAGLDGPMETYVPRHL